MQKLLLAFLFFSLPLQAQVVADSTSHKPLAGASILISGKTDTAIITENNGHFQAKHLPKGDYTITLSYLGYPTHRTRFSIPEGNFQSLPDTLFLSAKGRDLKEVVVISDAPAISIKGDTIEYNANKFKTKENAVVEDLLQKLPGIRIQRDGSIKAQGEEVQQVLVDGKEFFGNDPTIATKNLPADMVEKVQVLRKQSDMEEFTGIADGKKRKVINIITKKDRKRGLFGNVSANTGNNDRYDGGVNINSFSGERQLSLLAKANNVNRSGFTGGELLQMMMKNPDMINNLPPFVYAELTKLKGVKVDGDVSEIIHPAGYTDIHYGGLNFNQGKWQSNYFYNGSDTKNAFTRDRQNFLADTAYVYLQEGTSKNRNDEHRLEMSTEIKPFKISAKLNRAIYSNNQSENYRSFSSDRKILLNEGTQNTSSRNTNDHAGGNLLFMHKFAKKRRTLAISLTPDYYKNSYSSLNHTRSQYHNVARKEEIDQQTKGASTTGTFSGSINYTEPLSKTLTLQMAEEIYYSGSATDRIVKDVKNNTIDDRYSDNYNTQTFRNRTDLLLSVKYKELELTAGTAFEQQKLNGRSTRKGYKVGKDFIALLPHAYIKYRKLQLNYGTSASMPGMEQLQPLEDNSSPMITRKGNPDLQQEGDHHLSLSFTNSSKDQQRSQYLRLEYNLGRQKIIDQVMLDTTTGRQLISPINVNGNYNAGMDAGVSFPAGKNGSYINFGVGISCGRNIGYTNAQPNNTSSWTFSPEAGYSAYFGNRISLQVKGSAAYNNRRFYQQREQYWSFNYYISPMFTLPARLLLELEWDGFEGYNTSMNLLHLSITKELGKHFSLKLTGRDLLNQNKNIRRVSGNGYLEDVRNNMLGRYGLLGITYKLKFFPKQKS